MGILTPDELAGLPEEVDVEKGLTDIVEITLLAYKLHMFDEIATEQWMREPNTILFGVSPLEICIRGEADILKQWLKDKLGL